MPTNFMETRALPLVTIAIPTRNRARSYLPVALRSALGQCYPRVEVLVSDNASSDGTAALVESMARSVRFFRHPVDIGANANYNFCLSQARGDYFLLLHDDDAIDDDFVSACMARAGFTVREGVIRTGIRVIDDTGATVREITNGVGQGNLAEYFHAWFAGKTCWYLANTLFNTAQLRAQGGFRSRYGLAEDGFAIARLARLDRLDLQAVKASFRVHDGERTIANPSHAVLWGREYLDLLDCMCELVPKHEVPPLRRAGERFFAQLAYNRAGLLSSPAARMRASLAVLRLFQFRCWPTHRSKTLRFFRRAAGYARRRTQKLLARRIAPPPARGRVKINRLPPMREYERPQP